MLPEKSVAARAASTFSREKYRSVGNGTDMTDSASEKPEGREVGFAVDEEV